MATARNDLFSNQLQTWSEDSSPKTLIGLAETFGVKGFALLFLILLAIPALPLPTGGITHVFEIIAMLLALELTTGKRNVWLPKRWAKMKIGGSTKRSMLPILIRWVRWAEKYSKPRLANLLRRRGTLRVVGLMVFVLTAFAFLAPPFSGLDTLPALGVVIISLSVILDDVVLLILGLVCGLVGLSLVITVGTIILRLL